jgi:serine/threonine protein kinase
MFFSLTTWPSSGDFGVVHRAVEKRSGKTFAAKFVASESAAERAAIRKECEMMNDLAHPRLLHLHDVFEEPEETVMIVEL